MITSDELKKVIIKNLKLEDIKASDIDDDMMI